MLGTRWLGSNKLGCSKLLAIVTLSICTFLAFETSKSAQRTKNLTITCAPDKPIARPGESIVVRAWINDSSGGSVNKTENIEWKTSIGTITGKTVAIWSFPNDAVSTATDASTIAKVFVAHESLGRADCQLLVYLVEAPQVFRGPKRSPVISGRTFLLPGQKEPEGYGFYSYLLFSTPPKNEADRERYLEGIASYLLVLRPLEELEDYKDRRFLNVTLVPLKQSIALYEDLVEAKQAREAAGKLLKVYDYARAQVLLREFGIQSTNSGPFLISSGRSTRSSNATRLVLDMSRVSPALVWDWTKTFSILCSQELSWTDATLQRLALKVRNVMAIAAKDTPEVVGSLQNWIQVLKSN